LRDDDEEHAGEHHAKDNGKTSAISNLVVLTRAHRVQPCPRCHGDYTSERRC
jgi:hypothetical protein